MSRPGRVDARSLGPGALGAVKGVSSVRGLRSILVRAVALTLVALVVATLTVAARADAFIYWTSSGVPTNISGLIGRANLDGTGVNQFFIRPLHYPQGMAVDSAHIYWATNYLGGSIGRANLDGTGATENFILPATGAHDVAVDPNYVYWASSMQGSNFSGTIGRANLDGTGANPTFITTALPATGVAVDRPLLGRPPPGPPPAPTIADLVADVQRLGLPQGIERSLLAKLNAAQQDFDAGHFEAACGSLNAYVSEIQAQSGKKLDAAKAAQLMADARAIRTTRGCDAD